jgi:hypothetical protein
MRGGSSCAGVDVGENVAHDINPARLPRLRPLPCRELDLDDDDARDGPATGSTLASDSTLPMLSNGGKYDMCSVGGSLLGESIPLARGEGSVGERTRRSCMGDADERVRCGRGCAGGFDGGERGRREGSEGDEVVRVGGGRDETERALPCGRRGWVGAGLALALEGVTWDMAMMAVARECVVQGAWGAMRCYMYVKVQRRNPSSGWDGRADGAVDGRVEGDENTLKGRVVAANQQNDVATVQTPSDRYRHTGDRTMTAKRFFDDGSSNDAAPRRRVARIYRFVSETAGE